MCLSGHIHTLYNAVKLICLSLDSMHVEINLSLYWQPSREMGCQTEGPSTKDGQCQTIHDLKQHSWKHELKSERVFYSFILLSF